MRNRWVFLSLFALAACQPGERTENRILTGRFEVEYVFEETETSASGSTLANVVEIGFHAEYVTVRDADGGGHLFSVDRLRRFHWSAVKN